MLALLALGIVSLGALASIARPLLFATLQPELAEARGVPLRLVSVLFLAIVALAVAECAQIVGVLLVFTLMVGARGGGAAVTIRLWPGLLLSAALALLEAWLGLTLAFYTDWPTSFWITALGAVIYMLALLGRKDAPRIFMSMSIGTSTSATAPRLAPPSQKGYHPSIKEIPALSRPSSSHER